ncbi:MAG TPA: alpha-galactosidase [Gemmatimonadales bacterium]|nr:alpha-galactosidase [Gemmatimonadales bacterium]
MDRRTFVLLTGVASTAWLRPRSALARSGGRASGRLRFELDERRHWSLWYYGEAPPVPIVRDAELVAWVGDQPLTLADLEDSTVGNRRPPAGEAVVVRGRAAGVWVEAEFLTLREAVAPQAAITITVFPDRYLPTVTGVRFFRVPHPDVLGGDEPLVALVNGYASRDGCRVVTLGAPAAAALASHGALGLTRGRRGLALAFDGGEPGEGQVRLAPDGLEAVSDWLPPRPLRPAGDSARLRIAYEPAGDGLDALRAVFVPPSPLDAERLAAAVAPAGWCSRLALAADVTEAAVLANTAFCAAHFDRRFFRYIQLDDGYQRAVGDWDVNDKFPHGHRWLTDQIHAAGFRAGLWVAPFAVAAGSSVATAHPDWLLPDATGPLAWTTRATWGGPVYALDGAHPKVQQWLFELARTIVRDWGYDAVVIDFLHCATGGTAHYGGLTHAEAYRAGLAALRDGVGTEAFLLGGGAPLQHAAGFVNGMRIGPDAGASWGGLEGPARAAGLRSFYQRSTWLNDPDGLVVGAPLTPGEAEAWAALVAVAGGATWFADNVATLAPERVALLARTVPVAPVAGRPAGGPALERAVAPAIVSGSDVYPIRGPWRFRTGDDPAYSAREFDEEAWEVIAVPGRWAAAGHPDYAGFAWYRTRFRLPAAGSASADGGGSYLELGKVEAVDETFLNGTRVGQTGDFPASARSEGERYRRYRVPGALLNWGGDNALAVRVYAGTGPGGIWSVERDRPPRAWGAEGAPGWWTVVLVNWDDESQEVSLPLAALGLSGPCDTYDVWRDAPLAPATTTLTAALDARSARTVALRARAARPQVIGTTRHVVQGAVDLANEMWDAATRTLRAKAVNLDGRAYAVTIAVPNGLRPGACHADLPCTVRRLESGHVVLAWPGGDGRDIQWELHFRTAPATRAGRSP